jgi:hypothetical protein
VTVCCELLLGNDLDLVRQIMAQRAQRQRLIGAYVFDHVGEGADVGYVNALRLPTGHDTSIAVALHRTVGRERDALG